MLIEQCKSLYFFFKLMFQNNDVITKGLEKNQIISWLFNSAAVENKSKTYAFFRLQNMFGNLLFIFLDVLVLLFPSTFNIFLSSDLEIKIQY